MLGGRLLAAGRGGRWSGGVRRRSSREICALEPSRRARRGPSSCPAQRGRCTACERKKGRTEALRVREKHRSCRRERAGWGASREDGGPQVGLLQSKRQGHSKSGPEWGSVNPHPQGQRGMGGLEGPVSVALLPCVQVRDPRRACASPCPCGEGRGGASGAKVPAVGLADVRRVRRVVTGGSGSAGTGRSRAIGTWVGGRPGWSSGRCRWSRGEAGWWRGIWLSCWRCTAGRWGDGVSARWVRPHGPWRAEPEPPVGRTGRRWHGQWNPSRGAPEWAAGSVCRGWQLRVRLGMGPASSSSDGSALRHSGPRPGRALPYKEPVSGGSLAAPHVHRTYRSHASCPQRLGSGNVGSPPPPAGS